MRERMKKKREIGGKKRERERERKRVKSSTCQRKIMIFKGF